MPACNASQEELIPAKRRLFKALTVALSLLVFFVCLEIVLRAWGPKYYRFNNNSANYYSDPRGYFDIIGKEGDQPIYGITIQMAGSPPRRLPDNVKSDAAKEAFLSRKCDILGLGDSFTLGQGVRYEDIYLRRLEKLLAKDGEPLLIDNVAAAGYDLDQVCGVYLNVSAERQYPLAIYGFVLNDFGLLDRDKIVGLDFIDINNGGYAYSWWRQQFSSVNFICHKIDTIRLDRKTKKAYLGAFEDGYAEERFWLLGQLNGWVRKDGGDLAIVLFPLLYEFDDYPFQEIHGKIAAFCRRQNIPLLDLLPAFSQHAADELWVHATDHHPNEIAHKIAAEEIHAFLKRRRLLENVPAIDRSRRELSVEGGLRDGEPRWSGSSTDAAAEKRERSYLD